MVFVNDRAVSETGFGCVWAPSHFTPSPTRAANPAEREGRSLDVLRVDAGSNASSGNLQFNVLLLLLETEKVYRPGGEQVNVVGPAAELPKDRSAGWIFSHPKPTCFPQWLRRCARR